MLPEIIPVSLQEHADAVCDAMMDRDMARFTELQGAFADRLESRLHRHCEEYGHFHEIRARGEQ